MTEQELKDKVVANGWTIEQVKEKPSDPGVQHKSLGVVRTVDADEDGTEETMLRKWLPYYIRESDSQAFWQDTNPFPIPKEPGFSALVQQKIAEAKASGSIKAAYVERMDTTNQTALVAVLLSDDTWTLYHVYHDGTGLQLTSVSSTYPFGANTSP